MPSPKARARSAERAFKSPATADRSVTVTAFCRDARAPRCLNTVRSIEARALKGKLRWFPAAPAVVRR